MVSLASLDLFLVAYVDMRTRLETGVERLAGL
jgi:hypothetical protein